MRVRLGLSLALLIASPIAMAQPVLAGHDQSHIKPKPAKTAAAKSTDKRHPVPAKLASAKRAPARKPAVQQLPPADQYIGPLQVVGQREIGAAAWYGGYHLGRRTASGDRLDAIHATAAHRSLPLHSLVRVTNLSNGRSVVATITDRGPVSHSLLIDVSPRVADTLDMRRAGIVQVAVEPVAPASR